jgi:hypothetical protein
VSASLRDATRRAVAHEIGFRTTVLTLLGTENCIGSETAQKPLQARNCTESASEQKQSPGGKESCSKEETTQKLLQESRAGSLGDGLK